MAFALSLALWALVGPTGPVARRPAGLAITMNIMDRGENRRSNRVAQVVRTELATVLHAGSVYGKQRIPDGLQSMISIVDVDMSPDLRNARIKISVIGDRKDKISAVRWLQKNSKGIRHQLAQRTRPQHQPCRPLT